MYFYLAISSRSVTRSNISFLIASAIIDFSKIKAVKAASGTKDILQLQENHAPFEN